MTQPIYHEAPLGYYDTRFVVWAEGEHILIGARRTHEADPSARPTPGCVLKDDQTRQLLTHLQPGTQFFLEGVTGRAELYTWGNLHLQDYLHDGEPTRTPGLTSYDIRGGHDGLAKLIRRAMKDRTTPTPTPPERSLA